MFTTPEAGRDAVKHVLEQLINPGQDVGGDSRLQLASNKFDTETLSLDGQVRACGATSMHATVCSVEHAHLSVSCAVMYVVSVRLTMCPSSRALPAGSECAC